VLYVTRGLVDTLLRFAEEREPDSTTVPLAVTQAAQLPVSDLAADTPVFTHFYMAYDDDALNAVFGVDLNTPPAQTPGVFVSHPRGDLQVSKRDDLREIVFVAVPPWEDDSLAAFGRDGNSRECAILDVEPPEETDLV
jgi:hypothetical protein